MVARQVIPKLNDLESLISDASHRRAESSSSTTETTPPTPYALPSKPPLTLTLALTIMTALISSRPTPSSLPTCTRPSPPTSRSSTLVSRRPSPRTPCCTMRCAASAPRLPPCSTGSMPSLPMSRLPMTLSGLSRMTSPLRRGRALRQLRRRVRGGHDRFEAGFLTDGTKFGEARSV